MTPTTSLSLWLFARLSPEAVFLAVTTTCHISLCNLLIFFKISLLWCTTLIQGACLSLHFYWYLSEVFQKLKEFTFTENIDTGFTSSDLIAHYYIYLFIGRPLYIFSYLELHVTLSTYNCENLVIRRELCLTYSAVGEVTSVIKIFKLIYVLLKLRVNCTTNHER